MGSPEEVHAQTGTKEGFLEEGTWELTPEDRGIGCASDSLPHLTRLEEEDGVCPVPAEPTAPTCLFLVSLLFIPPFNKCQEVPAVCLAL